VIYSNTLDANSTLVAGSLTATPVAVNDSYTSIGNVGITVPMANGVLANDFAGLPGATLTTIANGSATNGGTVTLAADGSFSYNPPVGFEGADSFTYTLTNSAGVNGGTVAITVSGMIWFINNNSGACSANCNGRLSNPFTTKAPRHTVAASPYAQDKRQSGRIRRRRWQQLPESTLPHSHSAIHYRR